MRTGSPDRNRAAAKSRRLIAAAAGLTLLLAAPLQALADCKPTHASRSVVLASMGPCAFDPEELQFAGTPAEQAACLLRPVKRWAKLGPVLTDLPSVLAQRIGRTSSLPEREVLGSYMVGHARRRLAPSPRPSELREREPGPIFRALTTGRGFPVLASLGRDDRSQGAITSPGSSANVLISASGLPGKRSGRWP
jgi:hypothetical protein